MDELLEQITYEGITPKKLMEITNTPKTTLYRQLDKLVEQEKVLNNDGVYRKLRSTPSVGQFYDKMMEYHQQRLMDWQYRRKTKSIQADLTLQWIIDTPTIIKGKLDQYDEISLEKNLLTAYNSFQRTLLSSQ